MKTLRPALIAAAFLFLSACSSQIQHGLDERDANEIVSVLVSRGFDAKKVPEKGKKPTWAIEVSDESATEALRVLTELKLPRPQRLKTQALAQSSGLIETPAAEKLRQLEAQEGDIEESLETMDGVASASVELVVPPAPRPGQPPTPSKASALLRVHPAALERLQQQRAELRALVAASVDGLKPDDVVLVIDQVTLEPLAAPASPEKNGAGLRVLVVAMGATVSILAGVLMFLAWRLSVAKKRAKQQPAPATAAPPVPASPSRPVISPAVQRKVA